MANKYLQNGSLNPIWVYDERDKARQKEYEKQLRKSLEIQYKIMKGFEYMNIIDNLNAVYNFLTLHADDPNAEKAAKIVFNQYNSDLIQS